MGRTRRFFCIFLLGICMVGLCRAKKKAENEIYDVRIEDVRNLDAVKGLLKDKKKDELTVRLSGAKILSIEEMIPPYDESKGRFAVVCEPGSPDMTASIDVTKFFYNSPLFEKSMNEGDLYDITFTCTVKTPVSKAKSKLSKAASTVTFELINSKDEEKYQQLIAKDIVKAGTAETTQTEETVNESASTENTSEPEVDNPTTTNGQNSNTYRAKGTSVEERAYLKNQFTKSGNEGYDNIPWGTTLNDFIYLNLGTKNIENEGSVLRYTRKGSANNVDMTYKFYEEKLVGGVTIYQLKADDETTGDDINHRLEELYGKPNDVKESSEHHVENILGTRIAYTEEHLKATWNKSPTFKILLDIRVLYGDTKKDTLNLCMWITTNLHTFTISYDNPSLSAQIAESNAKLEKAQAEAKKAQEEAEKRRRMDNLDL